MSGCSTGQHQEPGRLCAGTARPQRRWDSYYFSCSRNSCIGEFSMNPLTTVEELALQLPDPKLVLVDCRSALGNPLYGSEQYQNGHISGAVFADVDIDLADPPGARGRHPLPSRERFAETLRRLGVNRDSHLLVYDDRDCMFAARFWWMVRWAGHKDISLLDGGFAAWIASGREVTTAIPEPKLGNFDLGEPMTKQVDVTAVESGGMLLVDARARERFNGEVEPIDHRAGHIPGAICMPFFENVDTHGKFIRGNKRFDQLAKHEHVVCYCGSGVTAAHNVFSMVLAGLPEPALYPGSWSEWIEDPSHPVAT